MTRAPRTPVESALPAGSGGFSRNQLIFLLLITLLAAGLRLFRLEEWSFWVDEAHTWRDATLPLDTFWNSARGSYPISYLLLRGLLDVLGSDNEGWLRLPFAFFGIATVPLLALVALPMVGQRAALVAALLLAVDPWHLYWSQNARAYVILGFFSMLSAAAWFHGVERKSWAMVAVSLATLVIAGLCHPQAYALLVVYAAYALMVRRMIPRVPMRAMMVGLVALALLAIVVGRALEDLQTFASAKPEPSFFHVLKTTGYYFRPTLLLVALGGVLLSIHLRDRTGMYLGLWASIPIALVFFGGVFFIKLTARYAFVSLPAVLLLVSFTSVWLVTALETQAVRSRLLRYLLPAVLIVEMLSYDYFYFTHQHGDRPRWREAVACALAEENHGLNVLTTNDPTLNYYLRRNHYRGTDDSDTRIEPILKWKVVEAGGGQSWMHHQCAEADQEGRTLVVVLTLPELREIDRDRSIAEYLRNHFEPCCTFPVWVGPKDQTVYVYRRK